MKKYIVSSLLVLAIVFGGIASTAQAASLTADQINAIVGLLQSFGADSTVIANVRVSLSGGTPTNLPPPVTPPVTPPPSGNSFCYAFNRDLKLSEGGSEIRSLAIALKKAGVLDRYTIDGGTALDGLETLGGPFHDVFGNDVLIAVKKFQAKYGISQTGYVGPLTRGQLNRLYGCNSSNSITVFSPNGGESVQVRSIQQIRWSASPLIQHVSILIADYDRKEISDDGRSSYYMFNPIAQNVPNSGMFSWPVPISTDGVIGPKVGGRYIIRIQNESDSRIFDDSNAPFTITQYTQ